VAEMGMCPAVEGGRAGGAAGGTASGTVAGGAVRTGEAGVIVPAYGMRKTPSCGVWGVTSQAKYVPALIYSTTAPTTMYPVKH
jgi:hypothetical protein